MTTSARARSDPSWRFMLSHPAHFISFGFGAGLSPIAPGTAGTLVGFPIYALIAAMLTPRWGLIVVTAMFLLGVWATHRTGSELGVADFGGICWDEVVAFVLILFLVKPSVAWFGASFFVFRFFDIVKPFPIRHFDRTLKNGFGVMLDDLLAAGYSVLVLKLAEKVIDG